MSTITRRYALSALGAASSAAMMLSATFPAAAQQWPSKPIRFVVPYSPGGISDIAARIVGAKLTEAWGQQVVVDNKPGGNGTIGTASVVKSPPDGYTWVIATVGDFTISQHVIKNIPYDPLVDLVPVMSLTDTPCVLAVAAPTPYKTVADVIADAKTQPGKISYSSPGVGAVNQLLMEWMAVESGTSYSHVPYKGGAPAGAAVAAGDVPLGLLAVSSAMPHLRSGKVRMVANTAATRSPIIPDVPTLQESGVKSVDGTNYTLLLGPKGTPTEIIDKLNIEITKILNMADIKEKLAAGAAVTIPSTPAQLAARLKRESAAFKIIVEKAKITGD
jgi:tripartite-type tricarboxylate transporter receptor subunit TctC